MDEFARNGRNRWLSQDLLTSRRLPTLRAVRWFDVVLLSLLSVLGLGRAHADSAPPTLSALASGVPCGLLGDCARFDSLGIHVGAALGLAQSPTKSLALLGRTRVSVSMLDALDVSLSLGAQHNREQTETPLTAQPLSVGLRVRLWPWFDLSGPDVALSVVQTIPSLWLGSGDAAPETTASLAGTKLWRGFQLDGSAGLLWREGLPKPQGLRLSGSGFVRLYQTPDPTLPRDSYRVGIQVSALFPLSANLFLAQTTALAVFEAATDRGLRFQLGIGAQIGGYRASGIALAGFLADSERNEDLYPAALDRAEAGTPELYWTNHYVDADMYPDGRVVITKTERLLEDGEKDNPPQIVITIAEARKLILDWIDARDKWYAEREAQRAAGPMK